MMVRNYTFEKYGMFNENYVSCFEDVEVNMSLLSSGFKNYICSECVSYHYESQTRNEDPKNLVKLNYDYHNNLLPFIKNNIDKIKNNIIII
jgi:GT2 family glycosyltransferase